MKRREFVAGLAGAAALPLSARAQQTDRVYSIALFSAGSAIPALSAFVDGLRELGWVEGKNIVFVPRYAENHDDRLQELAAELVRLKVDVIMTSGTLAPLAAMQATTTIPIVMGAAGDPVGSGLVANLERPSGNVTGLSLMSPDVGGKRLELLKELLPGISRVSIIWNAANPYPPEVFKETRRAAQTFGIELQSLEVRGPDDFPRIFEAARHENSDALITVEDPLAYTFRKQIVEFAATNRLPAIYGHREYVAAGGLMAYGASPSDLRRRAASYVDKILRGAKPADLPIQQPTKFELVINSKAAAALGLTIPQSLLARADEVIE